MNEIQTPTPIQTQTQTQEHSAMIEEDEISLIDLLIVIGEYKRFIALLTLTCGAIAAVVSLLVTPLYTAKTVFMPPQQQASSASSLLSSLGGLAGLSGVTAGIKSPDELYIALMKSNGMIDQVIAEFNLKARYQSETLADARLTTIKFLKITSDKKSGLITVEFEDPDPVFAATVANTLVKTLNKVNDRLAVTDAQQRRLFFETQITKTQATLAQAEARFREAQGKSGFQMPSISADTSLKNIAELHGQIAAREIQLQAIDRFAAPQNPELQRLTSELSAMRSTLQRLEQGSGVASMGTIQQEAMSAYRDMKTQESMLEAFVKQLELARVDEAKEGPVIQVVDAATPPERRSFPKRTLMVLISVLAGFFVSLLLVFVRHAWGNASQNPEDEERLIKLKAAWGHWR